MTRAWLIRAGASGDHEAEALDGGLAVVGFDGVPDLSAAATRKDVEALIATAYPEDAIGRIRNITGQLWALRGRMETGDMAVLPLKSTSQVALGRLTGAYRYRADAPAGTRHAVAVNWERVDVPRTAIQQDLLYSLGAFMTVCQISRNDGEWRLEQIMATGVDPGPREEMADTSTDESVSTSDTAEPDLIRAMNDRIQAYISDQFKEHALERLVEGVLKAEGFVTQGVDPGPDGGIDIYAGRGPLGLDSPKLIVQVKSSPTPVDAKTVRELTGVMNTHGADQALLVAWGGVNKVARQELRSQHFQVRVWDSDRLVEAVTRNYDRLPEQLRAELPLRQVWALVEDEAG